MDNVSHIMTPRSLKKNHEKNLMPDAEEKNMKLCILKRNLTLSFQMIVMIHVWSPGFTILNIY